MADKKAVPDGEPTTGAFLRFLTGNGIVSERTRLRKNELARLRTERALHLWYSSTPTVCLPFCGMSFT